MKKKLGSAVRYNTGDEKVLALVTKVHNDELLDLVYFPSSSAVEHVTSVPKGEGGVTWSDA